MRFSKSLFLLAACGLAYGLSGCSGGKDTEHTLLSDESVIGSVGFSLLQEDGSWSTPHGFWARTTSAKDPELSARYNRLIVGEYTKLKPESEGTEWFIDTQGDFWLRCKEFTRNVFPVDFGECELPVTGLCFEDPDCTYELRLHRGTAIEALTHETSWEAAPEAWLQGGFRWSSEFVEPSRFTSAYRAYHTPEGYPGGPNVEVVPSADGLTVRGWVRRAEEDLGMTIVLGPDDWYD